MDTGDAALVAACKKGNTEALGTLYDRYVERIYRFVYFKTFSKEVSEDIVSIVFLKVHERIQSFDETRGNFSQWIYSVARNAVVDHFRTHKTHLDIEDVFDLGHDDRTEAVIDARELLQKIQGYIEGLTARQREIVLMRIWEERSYEDIADIVGGTPDSVKMMFSRTMRDIRARFGEAAAVAFILSRPFV